MYKQVEKMVSHLMTSNDCNPVNLDPPRRPRFEVLTGS